MVIRYWEIENYHFFSKSATYYIAEIDPQQIKGIEYDDNYNAFYDITWKELLNQLKNVRYVKLKFSTYEEIIAHIHRDYSEGKSVSKFGDTLITTCGQHRLALAKFLKVPRVRVSVEEFAFDHNKFSLFKTISRNLLRLKDLEFLHADFVIDHQVMNKFIIEINVLGGRTWLNMKILDEFVLHVEGRSPFGILKRMFSSMSLYSGRRPREMKFDDFEDILQYSSFLRKHSKPTARPSTVDGMQY